MLGRTEMQTRDKMYCQTIRTVRDISRDDRARIATCSLRTPTYRQTNRQTDRQTDRRTDGGRTGGRAGRQADRQTDLRRIIVWIINITSIALKSSGARARKRNKTVNHIQEPGTYTIGVIARLNIGSPCGVIF